MRAFEVYLNDEKLCTAGMDRMNMLVAVVTLFTNLQKENEKDDPIDSAKEELHLRVSGLRDLNDVENEHFTWTMKELSAGDTITIKIIETEETDPPVDRTISKPKRKQAGSD